MARSKLKLVKRGITDFTNAANDEIWKKSFNADNFIRLIFVLSVTVWILKR